MELHIYGDSGVWAHYISAFWMNAWLLSVLHQLVFNVSHTITKGEKIITIDFHSGFIGPHCNCGPLRTTTISITKIARVLEKNIWQVNPDRYKPTLYRVKSIKTRTNSFYTTCIFKYSVLGYVEHNLVNILLILSI